MKKVMVALATAAVCLTALVFQAAPARGIDPNITVSARSQALGVKLEWSRPASADVAGYIVRRGESSGHEDRWPLNDFPVTGTSFVDENVTPGATYYYVVVPVLLDGSWGSASTEVSTTATGVAAGARLAHFHMGTGQGMIRTSTGDEQIALKNGALVDHDRVLLSVADLARLTGADLVRSEGSTAVVAKLPSGLVMTMEVGKPSLAFEKAARPDTCAPVVKDGVTYLPLRWVVEAMEGTLTFNPLDQSVTIEMPAR